MKTAAQIIIASVAVFHASAFTAWQFRNPKANAATVWTYYRHAVRFERLPEFQ